MAEVGFFYVRCRPNIEGDDMAAVMSRIHEEHREMLPHIKAMRTTAELIGHTPHSVLMARCQEAIQFLQHHLLPHARAEEQFLYPVIDRLEGARLGSALMRWDHTEIQRLTTELHVTWEKMIGNHLLTADVERNLRETLLSLHSIAIQHFTKEDELLVPLLESTISQDEADSIVHDMSVLERRLV